MRTLLLPILLLVVACSSSSVADGGTDASAVDSGGLDAGRIDSGGLDAGRIDSGDVVACGTGTASFPTFDRACATDADCTIGVHQTDCCGSLAAMGIAATERARFDADEAACEAMYPGCGCASNGVTTDDGTRTSGGLSTVLLACTGSVCATTVRGSTPCGAVTCTASQVCVTECSGIPVDAGALRSHCVDVPSACATSTDCSCFGSNPCPTGSCVSVSHGVPLCLCA